jgi:hypothetical protein
VAIVLIPGRPATPADVDISVDRAYLPATALPATLGWTLNGSGLCRGDVCVPLPTDPSWVRGSTVDLVGLARHLGQEVAIEPGTAIALSEPVHRRREVRESLQAPDFELPDLDGRLHRLSDYRGRKVLLYAWGSYCGCAFDLPGWQAVYQELADQGFVIIAVALDAAGADVVRPHVETGPDTMAPELRRLVIWWDEETWQRGGPAQYPCLVDREHRIAELYDIVNIPQAVWIDEDLRIVRPAEPAGFDDSFRGLDRPYWLTDDGPSRSESALRTRAVYVDALRDWVAHGRNSRFVMSADKVRARVQDTTPERARAAAHARLAGYLRTLPGAGAAAERHFRLAAQLYPENWEYFRQALVADEDRAGTYANDREWWHRVQALGESHYFAPIDMEGMPGQPGAR